MNADVPPPPIGDNGLLAYEDALAMAYLAPSAEALADDTAFLEWERAYVRRWTYDREELNHLLHELLGDGSGGIHPKLIRLWLNLISMPAPGHGLVWIRNNPRVPEYLRGLARGDIPLTHEGLHELESWRTTAYLRDLLMDAGALPRIDRQILLFERWYRHRITQIDDPEHARLLRQFTTWRLLPKLHDKAARGQLSNGSRNTAAGRFNIADAFLIWLTGRDQRLHQTTPDRHRHLAGRTPRPTATRCLREVGDGRCHMPRLQLPVTARTDRPPITQDRRLALLRRFLTKEEILLPTRVAACLVLLYAQPVIRLVRLTVWDVLEHDGQVSLRLGDPPTPVPVPFAAMLTELAANRANINTATNPDCDWLFPGGRAGQPFSPGAVLQQLRAHGIPVTQTRTAAFRQLVLQAPAPVIAQALGYHHGTATKHRTAAGGTWNRYPTTRREETDP